MVSDKLMVITRYGSTPYKCIFIKQGRGMMACNNKNIHITGHFSTVYNLGNLKCYIGIA